jgi:hypothetical protein
MLTAILESSDSSYPRTVLGWIRRVDRTPFLLHSPTTRVTLVTSIYSRVTGRVTGVDKSKSANGVETAVRVWESPRPGLPFLAEVGVAEPQWRPTAVRVG